MHLSSVEFNKIFEVVSAGSKQRLNCIISNWNISALYKITVLFHIIMWIALLYTLTVTSMKLWKHSVKSMKGNRRSSAGQWSHSYSPPETRALSLAMGHPTWPHVKKSLCAPSISLPLSANVIFPTLAASFQHWQLLPQNSYVAMLRLC
jgi:hypothetical protein